MGTKDNLQHLEVDVKVARKEKWMKWGWLLPLVIFSMRRPDFFPFLNGSVLIVFGYFISLEDVKSKTIPNKFLKMMLILWPFILSIQAFFAPEFALFSFIQGIVGFLVCGSVFLTVYVLSRKGLGGGDVKYMAVSGLFLGFSYDFPAMLLGTSLSAACCLILLLLKKITTKSTLPLAPFLYVGILMTIWNF